MGGPGSRLFGFGRFASEARISSRPWVRASMVGRIHCVPASVDVAFVRMRFTLPLSAVFLFAAGVSMASPVVQSTPPTVAGTPATPNLGQPNIHVPISPDDGAIRDALAAWLKSQSTRPIPQTPLEVKLISSELQGAATKLIDRELKKPAPSGLSAWVAGNGVIVGTLLGSLLALLGTCVTNLQNRKRDLALEKLRAQLAVDEDVRQLRFERFQKYHAPLYALFQQSRGITDKLYHHTYSIRNSPIWKGYELAMMTSEQAEAGTPVTQERINDPNGGRRRVYVRDDGCWKTLRMLDFMPILLKDSASKVLIEKILEIGRNIVKIISRQGGLAATGRDFSPLLGQYLAHFAILEGIYMHPPEDPFPPESQGVGYYPLGLDEEIAAGYLASRDQVKLYERTSS